MLNSIVLFFFFLYVLLLWYVAWIEFLATLKLICMHFIFFVAFSFQKNFHKRCGLDFIHTKMADSMKIITGIHIVYSVILYNFKITLIWLCLLLYIRTLLKMKISCEKPVYWFFKTLSKTLGSKHILCVQRAQAQGHNYDHNKLNTMKVFNVHCFIHSVTANVHIYYAKQIQYR